MTKIISFLKFIFQASILSLIILSLFPGSLLGLLFYGDLGRQPNLIENPFGTSINHFISYFFVSILGLSLFLKSEATPPQAVVNPSGVSSPSAPSV